MVKCHEEESYLASRGILVMIINGLSDEFYSDFFTNFAWKILQANIKCGKITVYMAYALQKQLFEISI